jgi:hypothetical protein
VRSSSSHVDAEALLRLRQQQARLPKRQGRLEPLEPVPQELEPLAPLPQESVSPRLQFLAQELQFLAQEPRLPARLFLAVRLM